MRDKPVNGLISFAQRERHRRGRYAAGCHVSGRWLKFHEPFDPGFGAGEAVWVDIMSDKYEDDDRASLANQRTRKLTSLMVRVEDLRAIVTHFDEQRQLGSSAP